MLYAELSPDRSIIAFVGACTDIGTNVVTNGLHLLDLTCAVRTIVKTAETDEPHSIGWSKDGKALVYDSSNHVYIYDLERGSSFFIDGSYPTWSPDGLWISYRRVDGTAAMVHRDGSQSHSILDGAQLGAGLRWSPDGRYLLFTDARGLRILDRINGVIATVMMPIDQYMESRLRWVRGLPK